MSRASGIVALVLISLSVLMGLAMASRTLRRPGLKRTVVKLHEHVALTALGAIALHGASLLGDQWLRPGWSGITVPFVLAYRPQYTGLGIIAGYLALLLGPSFYLRRRIGARRWRRVHCMTTVVWLLSVAHTIGAGTDAHRLWLDSLVLAPGIPAVYLLIVRAGSSSANAKRLPRRLGSTAYGGGTPARVREQLDRGVGRPQSPASGA